jgi:hypothetical protein
MTTTFQPGQHPDADQLNAFAEHALPIHEQQATLAHLATCADCRAVVYLAQTGVPEAFAPPQPVALRRPWFASWMVAFPAAATLAVLVLVTVHLRNANAPAVPVTAAHVESAPPLPPSPAEPAASPKPVPAPTERPQPSAAPSPALPDAAKTAAVARGPMAPQPPAINPSLEGNSLATVTQLKATAAANAQEDKKSVHGTMNGARFAPPPSPVLVTAAPPVPAGPPVSGALPPPDLHASSARLQLHSSASQYDSIRAQAQQPPTATSSASPNQGIYGGTGAANLNQLYVTDEATAIATTAAAPLQTTLLPRLPSALPATSFVSSGRHQLALDSAGTLYRSEDAGATWQPVPAQWTGRALKVALAPSATPHLLAKSAAALAAAKASAAAPQPASFELTTDSGGLWISSDGQVWKRQ